MAQRDSKRFESVVVGGGWGCVDADGFHLHDDPRATGDCEFSVCIIDSKHIAVFVNQQLTESARAQLAMCRPDWLDAIVFAQIASRPDAAVVVMDVEIAAPGDAEPARCAFAAPCVAFNAGLFKVVPQRYQVRFAQRGSWEVTMEFDYRADSWYGETTRVD